MRFESDAVADEGVAAVNMLFSRELRWIFREVSTRDVGVDAQVEVCRGRLATSRLLSPSDQSRRIPLRQVNS